jgi:hypothetical protein
MNQRAESEWPKVLPQHQSLPNGGRELGDEAEKRV